MMGRLKALVSTLPTLAPRLSVQGPSWRTSGMSATQRGYDYRWQKASKAFLSQHPLCQCPNCDDGNVRVTAATLVDHRIPHNGDMTLFWDRSNWQALAKPCHDGWKARLERDAGLRNPGGAS